MAQFQQTCSLICNNAARILQRKTKNNRKCLSLVRHINYEGDDVTFKTNFTMMTKEDQSHNYIEAYSIYGFKLTSGFRILGPCALFPKAVLHWGVPSAAKITEESLSLFCLLEPKPDILVIGKGDWDAPVNVDIVKYLKSKGINTEILPTEQACATFNFLNSERRVVAAGLIPPVTMRDQDDFYIGDMTEVTLDSSLEPESLHENEHANRPRMLKLSERRSHASYKSVRDRRIQEDIKADREMRERDGQTEGDEKPKPEEK